MTRLLLLTDFSQNATNAIDYAVWLFSGQACEFVLLNVHKTTDFTIGDILSSSPETPVFDSVIADNQSALNAHILDLNKKYAALDISFQGAVDYDVFTDAVGQALKKYKADYLVMGTSGSTGLKESIYGSNVLNVIRQVSCPLIVVPEGFTHRQLAKILYTQTQEEVFSKVAFKPLIKLLKQSDTQVHLLGIHPKEHKATIDASLARLKNEVFKAYNTTVEALDNLEAPLAIDAYEQLHPVDLHVFFAEEESIFKRFLFGSNTGQIRHNTHIPLLILTA